MIMKNIHLIFLSFLFASIAHGYVTNPLEKECKFFEGREKLVEKKNAYLTYNHPEKSKEKFELIVNQVVSLHLNMINELLGSKDLEVRTDWESPTFNAYALKVAYGNTSSLFFHGALYRHRDITNDAFAVMVCHEVGHLIGGAPFVGFNNTVDKKLNISVESQADYWASSVCLKNYFKAHPATIVMPEKNIKLKCDTAYTDNEEAKNICYRSGIASLSVTNFFKMDDNPANKEKVPSSVAVTNQNYPNPECRQMTFMAGATCSLEDSSIEFHKKLLTDKLPGDFLCSEVVDGQLIQTERRPRCWYNKKNSFFRLTDYEDDNGRRLITVSYMSTLPGKYKIKLVIDDKNKNHLEFPITEFSSDFLTAETRLFNFDYKLLKKSYKSIKVKFEVEFNDKVILNTDNEVEIQGSSIFSKK